MFKVRLKYNGQGVWINSDWIWYICQHEESQDTVIESKHGDVLHVQESVEEILDRIREARSSATLYGLDGTIFHSEV